MDLNKAWKNLKLTVQAGLTLRHLKLFLLPVGLTKNLEFFFCNKLEALFFNLKYLYNRLWNKDSTLQLLSSLLC